jgi:hypothetical protein
MIYVFEDCYSGEQAYFDNETSLSLFIKNFNEFCKKQGFKPQIKGEDYVIEKITINPDFNKWKDEH